MLKQKGKQLGFTLIELLVVVIIVAVLAAVGIPLLTGNIDRARVSEAEAGLGTVRTAMRAKLAETNGTLPTMAGTPDTVGIGINATDLDGRFFVTAAYVVTSPRGEDGLASTYCVGVDGGSTNNTAPQAAKVATIKRSMDETGGIYDDDTCTGTNLNP